MHFKAEIDTADYANAIYKIKRLAKILAVCAGIVVVSGSLWIITMLYGLEFATKHHKDPLGFEIPATVFFSCMAFIAVSSFLQGVWEIEEKARRAWESEFTEPE